MLIAHHINVYFTGRRRQTRCARIRSGSPPPAPSVPTPPRSRRLYTALCLTHTHKHTHTPPSAVATAHPRLARGSFTSPPPSARDVWT